ncbi:hypothetical protein F5X98DRAFT_338252 [Xylaria grammica]|nr:hypothetical protein F5X98DRAFT_338252 [Xylaria grammica]
MGHLVARRVPLVLVGYVEGSLCLALPHHRLSQAFPYQCHESPIQLSHYLGPASRLCNVTLGAHKFPVFLT